VRSPLAAFQLSTEDRDGGNLLFSTVERIVSRIVSTVDVPGSIDFESGYGDGDDQILDNIDRLLDLGVCGMIIVQ
jgi:2-methylisocitrate lyase-like PEP mutase family enzyme